MPTPHKPFRAAIATLLMVTAVACGGSSLDSGDEQGSADLASGAKFTWRRAASVATVQATAVKPGQYRIHLIDVGTGLSILVQGAGFTMLYDGGSGDDRSGITAVGKTTHNGNRLIAYLFAALGPSGPKECTPDGDGWQQLDRPKLGINHVFLSHPHEDHDSLLDDVLHCYDVSEVWDAGDNNGRESYAKFLASTVAQNNVIYHNAAGLKAGQALSVFGTQVTLPADTRTMHEGDVVRLDAGAKFELLHVDGGAYQDENLNSTVVRVELGKTKLLLMGDAESGARSPVTASLGHVEADLVARESANLKADILQVAHHGSSTSNRTAILNLIQPKLALIGVGPLPYSGVRLPDASVISAIQGLASKPTILRTDANDATITACAENGVKVDRIGLDNGAPGGCDNYIIDVTK